MRSRLLLGLATATVSAALVIACGDHGTVPVVDGDSGGPPDASDMVDASPQPMPDATATDAQVDGHGDDHFAWPDCTAQPVGVPSKTIAQIWAENPSKPEQVWLSGVHVTGITKGACTAGVACDLYLQQDLTYASLAAGAQHAIKMFVSANTAMYFAGAAATDQVDAMGWAYRYTGGGSNELLLQVDQIMPGCVHKTGSGAPTGVVVQESDLTLSAYEDTVGPLFVELDNVHGTPKMPAQTFALLPQGYVFDGGFAGIVDLSPYFLPGGVFTGLTQGQKTTWKSVSGVFAEYIPSPSDSGAPTKYLEVHPYDMSLLVP